MAFNSREYEWADVEIVIGGGSPLTAIRGVKYTEKIEREALYAKGRNPYTIQSGNISYDGEITLLQSEYETLRQEGGGSILSLDVNIIISYGQDDNILTKVIEGARFTEAPNDINQGDKFMEITLPFIALNIK
jgi:hypothetical protein